MEECPVCYANDAKCKLVCGHSFCYQCVKNWYHKASEPTCPMCRANMYFRGMRSRVCEWEEEREEEHNESVLSEAFDFILENAEDFEDMEDVMYELMDIQERYHLIVNNGYEVEGLLDHQEHHMPHVPV